MTVGGLLDGRYLLGGLIGRGGMGDVYRAEDTRLGRPVAVKFLRESSAGDAQRFASEWQTLARLNHPNLVRLYDAGEADGRAFLVMELIEGSPLSEVLKRRAPSPQETARFGHAVAGALAYVHEKGIVHRDVKPANILIGDEGGAWLADFGVARLLDAAGPTASGHSVGTPAYLAPEQIEAAEVGPPADVYALGLLLLEALTGQRAFSGTVAEVTAARLHRGPELPRQLDSNWRLLLRTMTARDPNARPPAAEVAAFLGDLAPADAPAIRAGETGTDTEKFTTTARGPSGDTDRLPAALGLSGDTDVLPAALDLSGDTDVLPGGPDPPAAGAGLRLRRPKGWSAGLAVLGGVVLLVLLGALVIGGRRPATTGAPSPHAATAASTATTTTTVPPTTTTPTTTTPTTTTPPPTTTPTTTPAPPTTISLPSVTGAADAMLSAIQNGLADGGIAPAEGPPLLNAVAPLLLPLPDGDESKAVAQLAQQVAQGVATGSIVGEGTISALNGPLDSLETIFGSSTSTTVPTEDPPPPNDGHGHQGHGFGEGG